MAIAVPSGQDRNVPLGAFNFLVSFVTLNDALLGPRDPVRGGFSEVTGLEATMEPKVIKAGGSNYGPIQRPGPVSFSTVVLKRGIIAEWRHLWAWFSLFSGADGGEGSNGGWAAANRTDVTIAILYDNQPMVAWRLVKAMPIKFRIGDLNAKTGEIAVEELHLAHEALRMEPVP